MRLGRAARRGRAASRAVAALIGLTIALSACGGGGGGGDGAADVDVLVVNRSRDAEAMAMLAGGEEGEPTAPCRARNYTFSDVVEPFQVLVNGQVVIDSATLEPNQIGVTLAAWVNVTADGTVELDELRPGRPFTRPATAGICT